VKLLHIDSRENALNAQALEDFLAADVIVVGAPMYNFGIPSQLKAWIDRIVVAGETFRYTASGPEGLAKGKQVIVALSRGGVYAPGAAGEFNEEEQMTNSTATRAGEVAQSAAALSGAARAVTQIVHGMPTSDGAGVKLRRVIGQPALGELDPFLMLDEFGTDKADDYIAGFPDHPHRGFETVTYMLDGRMRHRDNHGHEGVLVPGSVQWMTAGRGIVHSEMPQQQEGRMRGFQLWLNLPARDKMTAPRYQEFGPERIPLAEPASGVAVKVIAGRVGSIVGPISQPATDPTYLDVAIENGARFEHELPSGHAAFLYVFEGALRVGAASQGSAARLVRAGELAVLGEGTTVQLLGDSTAGTDDRDASNTSRAILVAGRPLREPVARYGPFVMNTREELVQAVEDFQRGRF